MALRVYRQGLAKLDLCFFKVADAIYLGDTHHMDNFSQGIVMGLMLSGLNLYLRMRRHLSAVSLVAQQICRII